MGRRRHLARHGEPVDHGPAVARCAARCRGGQMKRFGITVPFDGVSLAEHREVYRELVDLGYTDVWSAESGGADAFTPLVLAAAWAPELRLGTAIIPAY